MKATSLALVMLAALSTAQTPAKSDLADAEKTFAEFKKLVGGAWHGTVGGNLPVVITYRLSEDGKVIVGKGTVGDPAKPVMSMTSHLGIDPVAKKVYYLDQHGPSTVYFGHCTMTGSELQLDFRGMSADNGHYLSKEKFVGTDKVESSLYVIDASGKQSKIHDLVLERKAK